MPRLHIIYLPDDPGARFAFILDQANPMTEAAIAAWQSFAEKCGAQDIMLTADTIDTDPETSDGWQPDDDEPVDYAPAGPCCDPRVIGIPDLVSMVQAAHAAAWVPWEPANLDPESPKISTHPADSCAAVNNEALGCPMHAPILDGPWAEWPFFAANPADIGPTIVRICDHGISHPTPEEYAGGFDTPHLCDGCPCAPVPDFSIVVSDLANTRLPRGTLLLGVKDDPTPVTAPPASGWVNKPPQCTVSDGADRCVLLPSHEGHHHFLDEFHTVRPTVDLKAEMPPQCNLRQFGGDGRCQGVLGHDGECRFPVGFAAENWGTATIQPLGADGEPVGEAKDYPLAGPVTITKKAYPTVDLQNVPDVAPEPSENVTMFDAETGRSSVVDAGWVAPPETCLAGSETLRCTRPYGHEGLHDFGPFTRV